MNMDYFLIYLKLFLLGFCVVSYRSYTIILLPKNFSFTDASADAVYLISSSRCSLLVYKEATDYVH